MYNFNLVGNYMYKWLKRNTLIAKKCMLSGLEKLVLKYVKLLHILTLYGNRHYIKTTATNWYMAFSLSHKVYLLVSYFEWKKTITKNKRHKFWKRKVIVSVYNIKHTSYRMILCTCVITCSGGYSLPWQSGDQSHPPPQQIFPPPPGMISCWPSSLNQRGCSLELSRRPF